MSSKPLSPSLGAPPCGVPAVPAARSGSGHAFSSREEFRLALHRLERRARQEVGRTPRLEVLLLSEGEAEGLVWKEVMGLAEHACTPFHWRLFLWEAARESEALLPPGSLRERAEEIRSTLEASPHFSSAWRRSRRLHSLLRRIRRVEAGEIPEPAYHLRARGGTHRGRVRRRNEDAYLIREEEGLLAVADGVGGRPAGERASRLALEVLEEELRRRDSSNLIPPDPLGSLAERVCERLARWSEAEDPRTRGMATTLSGLRLLPRAGIIEVFHLGDSRLYLWRHGALGPLSRDHSPVGEWVLEGRLSREEGRVHPESYRIHRMLCGVPPGECPPLDRYSLPVWEGDRLLLLTDGVTDLVEEREMETICNEAETLEGLVEDLLEAALAAGGRDNITVVVAEVLPVGEEGEAGFRSGLRLSEAEVRERLALSGNGQDEDWEAPHRRIAAETLESLCQRAELSPWEVEEALRGRWEWLPESYASLLQRTALASLLQGGRLAAWEEVARALLLQTARVPGLPFTTWCSLLVELEARPEAGEAARELLQEALLLRAREGFFTLRDARLLWGAHRRQVLRSGALPLFLEALASRPAGRRLLERQTLRATSLLQLQPWERSDRVEYEQARADLSSLVRSMRRYLPELEERLPEAVREMLR